MATIYIANQGVGKAKAGEEVLGLTDERAEFLLAEGVIKAVEGGSSTDEKWQSIVKDVDGNDIKVADMVTKQLNQYLKDNNVEHDSGLLVDAKKDLVEAHATAPKE